MCLSIILPSGALMAMYVAIHAGNIQNTLELKLHIGFHGRLTKPTRKDSTELAIQLKIAIMKTIVKTIGFIIEDCIFICSGIISNCIVCILSAVAVSLDILASLSC